MIFITLLFTIITICIARPSDDIQPQNTVTVPPNCPSGQQWVNGQCRDVWPRDSIVYPNNVVTVPPNCPAGQEYINGQCRDVWRLPNKHGINSAYEIMNRDIDNHNTVTVPPNCKPGQQWINGQCRDVWPTRNLNQIDVIPEAPRCLSGEEYVNGACQNLWKRKYYLISKLAAAILNEIGSEDQLAAETMGSNQDTIGDGRNIINVPNQCPAGFKPDALGICREIFN